MIDPRVRSSLSEEEILFPTYNALQLQDILRNRSSEAFKDGVLAEGVIEKCAAYAAREHGDARRAIDLLRIAGELVERDKKELISLDYIDLAKSKMEADKILTSIEPMPKQHQITLYSIVELFKKARKKGEVNIFTGDVYNYYKDICFKLKIEVLTQRRISDIIGELDMFGLINAKVISKGRYGRSREIRVDWQESLAEKIDSILLSSLNL
jgi:cell division control protein 6